MHADGAHQHPHAQAAQDAGVERFFYSRSACVYAADKQTDPNVTALREDDAYPAMPEDGYGWEKLFTERMARHFREDFGLQTRVARYHNVYGPHGTWDGGREKAPAALCRKIARATLTGDHEIEIWGDGEQTRSFMYIDDCVQGTKTILHGDFAEPVNLGILRAGLDQPDGRHRRGDRRHQGDQRNYKLDAPQGVRGRNSDNTLIHATYGWEPSISLRDGPGEDLRVGLRPGQARRGEPRCASIIHDFAGHPFQAELSRELAARGHDVEHAYATQYASGKGKLERLDGDPDGADFPRNHRG